MRTEAKVIGLVVAVLLVGEVGLRVVQRSVSADWEHVSALPEISRTFSEAGGCRVLFLGNSLTRRGVDAGVFASLASSAVADGGVSAARVFPDDTSVIEWLYAYERFFGTDAEAPDVLVVGFAVDQLQDRPITAVSVARIGSSYSTMETVPEAYEEDLTSFGQRVELLMSKASLSFAIRERAGRRVIDAVVPNYRPTVKWINDATISLQPGSGGGDAAAPTFGRMERLVEAAAERGTEVVFVAMPTLRDYALPEGMAAAISRAGATFVDARKTPGIEEADYLDTYHLAPSGAETYTRRLARDLEPRLPALCR